ncbi:Preprotein translocase SecG subunit [Pseudooceanicola batsensis HTCC2597]|uniref:Protein-export membrane protein SecG n=1 Tax=Pseudooceanicola batsensis (strain ATCC BAA-863 / DSM 15984 / KCTC 12145 / HTCC2597) TaxID=252305 RepID=A3U1W1_PSEBH|nr:preprotein translocase subunit SecG [Pseudooceanicola batsensis]EAQ01895.1 Preprotein translocase SecG subunit [Pseudooceanicola batsensis HTCC2597]
MENVVLIIHLFLALALIGVVLLQKSEGGGLGMGGGGGGAMSGRAAATALGKVTWILAAAFIGTSIALTIIAADKSTGASVLDRLAPTGAVPQEMEEVPALPDGGSLLPPAPSTGGDLTPSAD